MCYAPEDSDEELRPESEEEIVFFFFSFPCPAFSFPRFLEKASTGEAK